MGNSRPFRPKANHWSASKPSNRAIMSRIFNCGIPGPSGGVWRGLGATTLAAVVVTDTLTAIEPEPLGVADEGLTVQVAPDGAPVQVKLMAWFMPPSPPKLSE
jgi:hypothetical protein